MPNNQFGELLEMAGIQSNRPIPGATPAHLFGGYKRRVSLVGTTQAGKSSLLAGLIDTAERLVGTTCKTSYPFHCRVLENNTNLREDVSRLRRGIFPAKTEAFQQMAAEAGLLFEWLHQINYGIGKQNLWTKQVQIPICDLAGEDLARLIKQVSMRDSTSDYLIQNVRNLISYVRESDGFIITLKGTRAQGLGVQLEQEQGVIGPDGKPTGISEDPDVNIARMLEDLLNYKACCPNTRQLRGVAVCITAADRIAAMADRIGFNILDPVTGQEDMEHFVQACFRSTYAAIHSLHVPVKYFPIFFETEKDGNGNELMYNGSPHIKLRRVNDPSRPWYYNANQVYCSEKSFEDIIEWTKAFAMMT